MTAVPSPAEGVKLGLPRAPLPMLAGAISVAAGLVVHLPVLGSEPIFVLINTAVTCVLITVGLYLAVSERERFTGVAFLIAGTFYPVGDLDIYPGWGAYLAYVLGDGPLLYGALGWGILRYGRDHLENRWERVFVAMSLLVTSGSALLGLAVARPEWLGYPANTSWFTLWPDRATTTIAAATVCVGFIVTAIYFTTLLVRRVRATPAVSRGSLQPLAVFGSGLAIGGAMIGTIVTLAPGLVPLHTGFNLIGMMTLGVAGALVTGVIRHRLLSARLIEQLPDAHTPGSINSYIRRFLRDESAELLFWSDESESLIDGHGLRRTTAQELDPCRMGSWIKGTDGARVAMLTCDTRLSRDPSSLASLGRVVSLIADNARLTALLRMRLVQLTATRTAEQLASMRARENFRRDLHDGVQQTIAAARMDLDGLDEEIDDDVAREAVTAVSQKLVIALEQIRSLKSGDRPPELQIGLKAAIERSIAELRMNAHTDIHDGDLGILTLPVYYVVREALTNVHKHAPGAAHVDISVTTDGRMITIVVHDDGDGGAALQPGRGLAGVQDRVSELSGTLQLDSLAGQGTTLRAVIPCVS